MFNPVYRYDLIQQLNRPGFPGECFICELRLPDHRFRWKHNKLFLLLPVEYGPAFPAIVDCYNRAEMSPEAAGIAACLMTYSHHACRTECYAMTVHYYRLRDYALQHPECSAIMRIID
ncbi:antirestriction protein [Escherichia coli]|nr:hypothetical protein [Escherichia coli]EFB9198998.1 antirestriction protein [Escherichia coli]EFC6562546.1 antirestriction protein [Escherichia coli]